MTRMHKMESNAPPVLILYPESYNAEQAGKVVDAARTLFENYMAVPVPADKVTVMCNAHEYAAPNIKPVTAKPQDSSRNALVQAP